MNRNRKAIVGGLVAVASVAAVLYAALPAESAGPPPLPPARKIPAITAEDQFPGGCVDCHLNYEEMKLDTRFATLLAQWETEVPPKVLASAKATAPKDLVLSGKHPPIHPSLLQDIPTACLACHAKDSTIAPPFSRMIHHMHLTGGQENPFLTLFQGECTHCHKLDLATGSWSLPSGPER